MAEQTLRLYSWMATFSDWADTNKPHYSALEQDIVVSKKNIWKWLDW